MSDEKDTYTVEFGNGSTMEVEDVSFEKKAEELDNSLGTVNKARKEHSKKINRNHTYARKTVMADMGEYVYRRPGATDMIQEIREKIGNVNTDDEIEEITKTLDALEKAVEEDD